MTTASNTRYQLIEPLRGLAAIWVFLFHYQFTPEFQRAFPQWHALLKAGDRAVPMFFVISGFCLAAAAERAVAQNESLGRFLQRRAWRIFPTYWLSIAAIVVSHWLMVGLNFARTGARETLLDGRFHHYGWFDWIKIATLTQIFDQRFGLFFGRSGHVNGAYWTLSIEFQFYLIVALSLLRQRWFLPLTGLLSVVSVVTYYHPSFAFAVRNTGICIPFWSWFALGVAVFALLQRGWTPERIFGRHAKQAALISLATISSTFAAIVLLGHEVERLVFAAGFAVLLWTTKAIDLPEVRQLREHSFGVRALGQVLFTSGAMSYSLYLMHNQVSDCFRRALKLAGVSAPVLGDLLCMISTLLVCYAFFRVCEAPFLRAKQTSIGSAGVRPILAHPPVLLQPVPIVSSNKRAA